MYDHSHEDNIADLKITIQEAFAPANDHLDHQDFMETEVESLATVLSKLTIFRAAADEMARDVSNILKGNLANDLQEIRIRRGLFSVFKKAVPDDVMAIAKSTTHRAMDEITDDAIEPLALDYMDIARNGISDIEGDSYFKTGRVVEFYERFDERDVVTVARLGIINTVEMDLAHLDDVYEMGLVDKKNTHQQNAANVAAFYYAANRAIDICEELKSPLEKKVLAIGPTSPLFKI